MKKRIIDSHTMKVFITHDDLKRNGITALDLLGDHNQIEKFFYKILDKVDTQHLFAIHEPLTFRVIPDKLGLNIIISCREHSIVIKNNQVRSVKHPNQSALNYNVIKLETFEDFIQVAHLLKLRQVSSNLYRYQGHFYLELVFNNQLSKFEQDQIKDRIAIAFEYGHEVSILPTTLKVHGKLIMKNNALEQGCHYFH